MLPSMTNLSQIFDKILLYYGYNLYTLDSIYYKTSVIDMLSMNFISKKY